jgi:hypothetical protein
MQLEASTVGGELHQALAHAEEMETLEHAGIYPHCYWGNMNMDVSACIVANLPRRARSLSSVKL